MSVQTQIDRLASAKAAIKTAIEGKGVTVPDGTLLDGMASLIESIEAGGGGGIRATYGTVVPTSYSSMDFVAIEHGLGVRPSFVISFVLPDGNTEIEADFAVWAFSSYDYGSIRIYKNGTNAKEFTENEISVEATKGYWDATTREWKTFAFIQQVNDVSFTVHSLLRSAGKKNVWIAFADPIFWS